MSDPIPNPTADRRALADDLPSGIKVTVTDPDTGEVLDEQVIKDDYVVLCHGRRYLKSTQVMGKTHTLHVAWEAQR